MEQYDSICLWLVKNGFEVTRENYLALYYDGVENPVIDEDVLPEFLRVTEPTPEAAPQDQTPP